MLQFNGEASKQTRTEHSLHWTLGTAALRRAAFSGFFLASFFFCSQALSTPAPCPPLTPAVGRFANEHEIVIDQ